MELNIFEIKLDDRTEKLLPRIYNWARFFYICTLMTGAVDIAGAYYHIHLYNKYAHFTRDIQKTGAIIDITFLLVYAILLPIQAYYLYRFSKEANKALQYGSSEEFNAAFQCLLKHAMIASLLFFLNSIWGILQAYFAYDLLVS